MLIPKLIALAASAALWATAGPAWAGSQARHAPATVPINNLARTPYQGWNTYYGLGSTFTEQTIKDEADALVSKGLAAAGYNYVWIDGGWWNGARDASGAITVDSTQWPDGMKAVADYIHSRGLKAGIYTDSGLNGCGGANQGSYGRYQQDVNQFAGWGYDAVKVDFCGSEQMGLDPATVYGQFRDAVLNNSSHRPMLFNICNPFIPETGAAPGRSAFDSYTFGPSTGNSWRTDTDIGFPNDVRYSDVLRNLDADAAHPEAAGPGHWNDPDYLGPDLGMTDAESRSQFSMWSIVAAPLMIGSDVRKLSDSAVAMLTNAEVLAVDQDRLGIQGTALSAPTASGAQVWTKPLANGDVAVALLNRGTTPQLISTTAGKIGLSTSGSYAVRDLWQHSTTESAGTISATVAPHDVVLYRVSRNGNPATMTPATTLSPATLTATAQAALPLVAPGDSFPVSATFTDNGRLAVRNVKLTLAVPAGWTATPTTPAAKDRLDSGQSIAATWQVTAAPGALPGTDQLAVTAGYDWQGAYSGATSRLQTLSATESTQVQVPAAPPSGTGPLSHHPWLDAASGYLVPRVDLDDAGGGPLTMHGVGYPTGVGTASPSTIDYYVGGQCSTLTATVGIDDSADFDPTGGTAVFQVYGDGVKLYDSGLVTRAAPQSASVNLGTAKVISLVVGDGGDGGYNDRTDWGGLRITCGAPVGTQPSGPWPHFAPSSSVSATATSANAGYPAGNAVDGQVTTLWHSQFSPVHDPLPISLTMDLGSVQTVTGLTYQPRLDGAITGTITGYTVEVSSDGVTFTPAAAAGTWTQDALLKSVEFAPVSARYVRLTATAAADGYASAADVSVAARPTA
ncbi:Alpha-galactosidase [Catenulispora acidiphila DSM 44928]|uniref:Alpha-galactosidase n=1 Tax=Catenulispora acidiphila (strain DSM 44928 / JCM 14897 / NBRC 102108 / NRRL B-24433 / ID139908) TaxID=479433 RepID=C7Q3D1_CATAD|nr:NPCBM/NEW2 domain-containing protein [Catenulispora acidiphila]ACU73867.1 Alpha-galactosidase [Catenulispora acidiphila DSM 44928]